MIGTTINLGPLKKDVYIFLISSLDELETHFEAPPGLFGQLLPEHFEAEAFLLEVQETGEAIHGIALMGLTASYGQLARASLRIIHDIYNWNKISYNTVDDFHTLNYLEYLTDEIVEFMDETEIKTRLN